jgi:hypothetical protein
MDVRNGIGVEVVDDPIDNVSRVILRTATGASV